MTSELITAVLGVAGGVLTTVLTVLYGPAWKDRLDRSHEQRDRSERLLARYSEPLTRAAFDLQSRLYNILQQGFVAPTFVPESYGVRSTLWLFGQYLAWVEILRREVQVLDLGDVHRTARLQLHLLDISDMLASRTQIRDRVFNILRAEQRAIGELMVVDREVSGERRSDCMGYGAFVERMGDAAFAEWFNELSRSMETLTHGVRGHTRPIYLQRALIDLIDFLDPERLRFPDPDVRGKVPLPPNAPTHENRKRTRPPGQLARFRWKEDDPDPRKIFDSWANVHGLENLDPEAGPCHVVRLPSQLTIRPSRRSWFVKIDADGEWVELSLAVNGDGDRPGADRRLPRRSRPVVDDLLTRFDRPRLVNGKP